MKIVDMHCDTLSELLKRHRTGERAGLAENKGHLDLHRMKNSGYLLQNFAMFVDSGNGAEPWEEVCALYELYRKELAANEELIAPVLCYEDIEKNKAAGKMSALLTVEEGAVCGGRIEKLESLYRMGVRMMTLTWNYPNELGWPNLNALQGRKLREAGADAREYLFTPDRERGLTELGREFVEYMEHLGIIPDVSHFSDKGFYDVLACMKKPFVASHSNARAVCGCVRNLTDEMIRSLAEKGGCMGLNYCVDFLTEPVRGKKASVSEILSAAVCHAKHIVKVGGIGVLGLGSDFDGIDTNEALPGVQSMEILWNALHGAGFAEDALEKIFSGNVLRVYREWL